MGSSAPAPTTSTTATRDREPRLVPAAKATEDLGKKAMGWYTEASASGAEFGTAPGSIEIFKDLNVAVRTCE